jgi:hypothetical protein
MTGNAEEQGGYVKQMNSTEWAIERRNNPKPTN